ncbi:MAG: hypothetical protein Q9179_000293 [Wetmoreana sp. 5 TL-2023]
MPPFGQIIITDRSRDPDRHLSGDWLVRSVQNILKEYDKFPLVVTNQGEQTYQVQFHGVDAHKQLVKSGNVEQAASIMSREDDE